MRQATAILAAHDAGATCRLDMRLAEAGRLAAMAQVARLGTELIFLQSGLHPMKQHSQHAMKAGCVVNKGVSHVMLGRTMSRGQTLNGLLRIGAFRGPHPGRHGCSSTANAHICPGRGGEVGAGEGPSYLAFAPSRFTPVCHYLNSVVGTCTCPTLHLASCDVCTEAHCG